MDSYVLNRSKNQTWELNFYSLTGRTKAIPLSEIADLVDALEKNSAEKAVRAIFGYHVFLRSKELFSHGQYLELLTFFERNDELIGTSEFLIKTTDVFKIRCCAQMAAATAAKHPEEPTLQEEAAQIANLEHNVMQPHRNETCAIS